MAEINGDRIIRLWQEDRTNTVTGMESAPAEVAGLRRYLSLVHEKAPIHVRPYTESILGSETNRTLVKKAKIVETALVKLGVTQRYLAQIQATEGAA